MEGELACERENSMHVQEKMEYVPSSSSNLIRLSIWLKATSTSPNR